LEPSLFFKGQTTSLLASVTEKELVSELRGGMVAYRSSEIPRVEIKKGGANKEVSRAQTGFM
jgi:hypothetical protein